MISLPIYVIGGITMVYSVMIIIYRPYKSWVHNVGLLINQIGVTICMGRLILQNYFEIIKKYDHIIIYCQLGWLGVICIWAIIRIIY